MNKKPNDDIFTWPQFVAPQRENVYNREKALPYWFSLSMDDAILYLSREMLSSSVHIRIGVKALGTEPDNDAVMLFGGRVSLAEFQNELSDLYNAVYELASILHFYGRNREKASKDNQQIWPISEMEFPEKFSKIYLNLLPEWYQQIPEKFLSIVMPLFETKLSQLGECIKKLHSESNINDISLGQDQLGLRIITSEMLRGYNILNEEFFLLKSCANSHHH